MQTFQRGSRGRRTWPRRGQFLLQGYQEKYQPVMKTTRPLIELANSAAASSEVVWLLNVEGGIDQRVEYGGWGGKMGLCR